MKARGKDIALKVKRIRVILLDVDGVLTDGRIILGPEGVEMKFFDAKDGHRIKLARRGGLKVFFVTGRQSVAVERRGSELGVDGVFQAVKDKMAILEAIAAQSGASRQEMAYMGDDLVDLPLMKAVGLSGCPSDAVPEVLERADMVLDKPGGRGAAGLWIEAILKAQGKWEDIISNYL